MSDCPAPGVGQIVRVRQRRYLVDESRAAERPGDSPLVRLSCLDDDALGQALEVLWDHEVDVEPLPDEGWRDIAARGFDPADRFAAYVHAIRWNCVTATDPKLFRRRSAPASASTPTSSSRAPRTSTRGGYLHGAACHGCLLIAETSCEQFNEYLDRALVVPTVDSLGAEFFPAKPR